MWLSASWNSPSIYCQTAAWIPRLFRWAVSFWIFHLYDFVRLCIYSIYYSVVSFTSDICKLFLFLLLLSEEDGTESISTTTARESTEIDDDHEKSLLSPLAVSGDVAFVKEVQKWYWTGEENRRLLQHHCLDLLHFYFFFHFFSSFNHFCLWCWFQLFMK